MIIVLYIYIYIHIYIYIYIFPPPLKFLEVGWDWAHSALRPLFGLLYQLWMVDDDDDECGAIGGMLGKGNGSTRRKPAPVLLCPPRWPRGTFYPHKLAITSPTSGGRSVGIVRSRTQTMDFFFLDHMREFPLKLYLVISPRYNVLYLEVW
jgi:hypothetical protein